MKYYTSKSLLTFLAVVAIACASIAQTMIVDKIVGKVGSELILLSELEDQYQYISKQQVGIGPDAKCGIMENLIAQKVIIYQAKVDSVEVSDEEVEAQLDYRFDNILRQMNGDEAFFKEYYGFTVAEMRDRVRDDQYQQILADKMQSKLIGEVTITPKEIEQFYNEIPQDSLPYLNAEVEISEIVINPQVNRQERLKALTIAQDIRAQIIEGAISFEEAARKYSSDGTAQKGGDLGFAKRGVYVPDFEAAAFQLTADEISEVVETEFGFHIIQLIERRGNAVHARHILITPEITPADEQKAQRLLDSVKQLVELDSISFNEAVRRYSSKDELSYSNNGRIKNPKTGNTFFETGDLDPDTYFEINDLKPGQLSNIIETTDLRGNKQFKVIQLVSQTKPHKVSLSQDYNKLTLFAKESKKAKYFNDWVTEKMDETYIKIDKDYNYCDNLIEYIVEEIRP